MIKADNFEDKILNKNPSLLRSLSAKKSNNFNFNKIKKFKKFKTVVIIGMGGSILGSKALYSFLKHKIKKSLNKFLIKLFVSLISLYRHWISPLYGPRCRFIPTCSQYALEAISKHGPWKGGWLTFKRLLRCHPLTPCGCDPVPD